MAMGTMEESTMTDSTDRIGRDRGGLRFLGGRDNSF